MISQKMKIKLLVLLLLVNIPVFGQELKVPLIVKLRGKSSDFEMKLVYCPEGKLFKGDPEDRGILMDMKPFYISETEVTTGQLMALMGETGIAPNKTILDSLNVELKETYKPFFEAGSSFPLLFVTPDQALGFCKEIQSQYDQQIVKGRLDVESIRFYLPIHDQWVYAARACTSEEESRAAPHFFRWINTAQISQADKNDLQTIWANIKGESTPLVFDQSQILQVMRNAEAQKNTVELKRFLTWALGQVNGPDWKNDLLRPSLKSPANRWGMRGIHDNGTEWTLEMSIEDRANKWGNISEANGIESVNLFLAGPPLGDGFSPSENRRGQLNKYTLWGGPTLSGQDFSQIEGVKYSKDFDLVGIKPTFRVCVERALDNFWLLALREDLWAQEKEEIIKSKILEKQARLKTFVPNNHDCHGITAYYLAMVDSKKSETNLNSQIIEKLGKELTLAEKKPGNQNIIIDLDKKDEGGILGALAGRSKPEELKGNLTDKDFFELLSKAVEN